MTQAKRGVFGLAGIGVFVLMSAARPMLGQTTGSIVGRVVDATGAALPGATVEATSERLQGARTAVTDRGGAYRFPAVPPGAYRVRATIPGFRAAEATATVSIDATATVDLKLSPSTEESVLVSGEAPVVDTSSTTTGTSYSGQLYGSLPVGRNYASIVRLNPGVSSDLGQTHGRVLALTIDGATSAENIWLIEGINTTDIVYGTQGKLLSEEFIQEVQVKTGGYQAEYGGALGGVINVATKSGGNAFHGGAFVYYDSGSTRADLVPFMPDVDSSGNTELVTPGNTFDFGVDLGGYLVKDRVWFYGLYDRVDAPSTITDYQDPSNTEPFPLDTTTSLYGGKLTVNVSSSTTFVATVFSDPTSASGAACGDPISSTDPGTWQCQRTYGGLDGALRLDQLIGTHLFAAAQASEHRDSASLEATGAGAAIQYSDGRCDGGTPESPCFRDDPPKLSGGLGLINGSTDNARSKRVQYGGSATLYSGNHEVKAGGEYQTVEQSALNYYTGGQAVSLMNEYGQEYFRHDFFARNPSDPTPVVAPYQPRGQRLGLYGQDAWRAAPNLTINAGVRFDQQSFRDTAGRTVLETSNEWQPRFGIVWDPWNDGRTRAYASVGRFYYALPLAFAVSFGIPTIFASTFNFDPTDTTQAEGVINHPISLPVNYSALVDAGLKGIYQDELTIGFERALTPTLSVGIKGTYRSIGRTIEDRCDLDPTRNNGSNCAITNPGSSGRYARGDMPTCNGLNLPYNACSETGAVTAAAKRIYRGIEVLARESIGDRLFAQISYVYSSLRGNYPGGVSETGQTAPGILGDFDYPQYSRNNYGVLAGDHPHSARMDASYTFAFKAFVGLSAYVQSGSPRNRLGLTSNPFSLPFTTFVYLVPRGSEGRLPTLWEADLTAGYPFAIGPVTVTPQVYLFNLFNNQITTYRANFYRSANPPGYPDTIYDPVAPPENQSMNWQKVVSRQDPRLFRAALRISF